MIRYREMMNVFKPYYHRLDGDGGVLERQVSFYLLEFRKSSVVPETCQIAVARVT
jgi:hypothetical protein